jgi:ribosomal protein S18 acetylase RimI-like enzyme
VDAPIIEQLGSDEWETLRVLRLRALTDSPDAFSVTLAEAEASPESYWRGWASWAERDDRRVFVVRRSGEAHGLGSGGVGDDGSGHIGAMWVAPELRGTGAGGRLFDTICAFLGDAGATRLELTVTQGNEPAIRLYESRGFRFTGEWTWLRAGSSLRNLTMAK